MYIVHVYSSCICFFTNMYGWYFLFVVFLYCNLLQITLVEVLLLPFLYIQTIFNKCIQTLKDRSHLLYASTRFRSSFSTPLSFFTFS